MSANIASSLPICLENVLQLLVWMEVTKFALPAFSICIYAYICFVVDFVICLLCFHLNFFVYRNGVHMIVKMFPNWPFLSHVACPIDEKAYE